jgi:pimeloyl-ACP methyl ester carboxylesterase
VVLDAGLGEPGSLAWAGVLPAVAGHTRVIAYDRAGTGASDPVSPLTVDDEIGDLAALIGEAADGRCVLAGHSWGGLLVQLATFRHPDLVAGLVLVDPADEEVLAAIPWAMRAAMSAPGNVALIAYRLGLHCAGRGGASTSSLPAPGTRSTRNVPNRSQPPSCAWLTAFSSGNHRSAAPPELADGPGRRAVSGRPGPAYREPAVTAAAGTPAGLVPQRQG